MIWLLALACGDKDTDGTTGDSSVVTEDSGEPSGTDSAQPTDSGEPTTCSVGAVRPLTVPIETVGTEVRVETDCVPTSVLLGGSEVEFSIGGGDFILVDASTLTLLGSSDLEIQTKDEQHTTTLRGHTAVPTLEKPSDLFEVEGETLLHIGETSILSISGGDLILTDTSDWSTQNVTHDPPRGLCSFGKCFLTAGYQGAIGQEDGTVIWTDIEKGTLSWDLSGDIEAVDISSAGPRALTRDPNKDLVTAHELSTGKSWEVGVLGGDLKLLDELIVHASCTREKTLTFTDIRVSTVQTQSVASSELACEPTSWRVQLSDIDGDGSEDQVHVLTYADGVEQIAVRHAEEKGWGGPMALNWGGSTYTYSDATGYLIHARESGGTTWRITSDGKTVTADNPVFVGMEGAMTNVLATSRPSPGGTTVMTAGSTLYARSGPWNAAANLSRSSSELGTLKYEFKGAEIPGLDDGVPATHDDIPAFYGEDLLIDEREMTTGADWDFRVSPFGPAVDGQVWLAHMGDKGLGLSVLDLDDPADDEGRLKKRPDLLMSEWNELIDESLSQLRENPLAVATAGHSDNPLFDDTLSEIEDDLLAGAAFVTVPWDTGTDCPLATVMLAATSTDVDTLWDGAVVVSTGSDATCSDLAVPLGSADLFGDEGWSVVMSDGTAWRISEFQIPEKVVMEKDGDFYGMTSGDLNGDGLGDAVFYGDEGARIWLSAGDGSGLDHDTEAPEWVHVSRISSVGPGTGASAIFPTSWAVMLD